MNHPEPSITLTAKLVSFIFALYLGYKEVRTLIKESTERDINFAYLQKDVEGLKAWKTQTDKEALHQTNK